MQIMNKKNQIYLLLVALFILLGTPARAQEQKVTVEPAETSATVTWPTDEAAASYQIDIYNSGAVFCHLTLGPTGQLLDITFDAPQRHQQSEAVPSVLSFMVTGLDAATRYNYVLSALNANGTPLHVYIGAFATTGYPGEQIEGGDEVIPTPPIIPFNPEDDLSGMEHVSSSQPRLKGIRDGRLLLYTPEGVYDVSGKIIVDSK